nr:GldG family protein [Deltaproteobacteria bacterium]
MTRASRLRHAFVQTVLWAAIAVVGVDLAGLLNAQLDLTADQRHTLSNVAVDASARLQKPVTARVFFTRELAAPYHEHRTAVLDLLESLREASGGKLEIRESDPTGDREAADEARTLGVEPVPWTVKTWDRQEASQIWMGVAFVSGDRVEAVPRLSSIPHLEYDLVRALQRVATPADDRRKIGWLLGDGEPDPRTFPEAHPLAKLGASLGGLGELVPFNPGEGPFPDDLDAILVVAPQTPIPAIRQLRLDQALMGGTATAYFLAGHQPDFRAGRTTEVRHDLHPLLARYGADVGPLLLLDRTNNEKLPLPSAGGWVQVNHPLAVVALDIDRGARPLRALRRAVAPFATPVSVGTLPPGVRGETWI